MLCKSCKREIDDDSIFCKYCGEKQIRERRKKKTEIKVPAPKQLPSGTWFGRVTVEGQRVSISAPTEKEYYAKARAAKAGLIEIAPAKPKDRLKDYVRKYIDDNSAVLSPATVRGYEIIYKNRFKQYMDMSASKINFQQMINSEAAERAPKTVANSWGLIRLSLDYAGFTVPTVKLPKAPVYSGDWLDYEQIKLFLEAIKGQPAEPAALLALHSLRQSELLDLTVEDFGGNCFTVKGAVVQDKDNKFVKKETNKNRTSTRVVPVLIPRLLEVLPASGNIVTIHPSNIRRGLKAACEKAKIPVCSIHDLRRSFASLAYHLKWNDRTTMQVGGWSDMKTVKAVYEKLSAQDKNKDIKRMQGFYSKIGNKKGNEIEKC